MWESLIFKNRDIEKIGFRAYQNKKFRQARGPVFKSSCARVMHSNDYLLYILIMLSAVV